MRSALWGLVVAAPLAAFACSTFGSDSSSAAADGGAPEGTAGGPCYGNGSCNPGLTCVAATCLASSGEGGVGGGDGGADASTADGGLIDVDGGCVLTNLPSATAVSCPGAPANTCSPEHCCVGSTSTACSAGSCTNLMQQVDCDSKTFCTKSFPGTLCCLQVKNPFVPAGRCPEELPLSNFNTTACGGACGATDLRVCANSSECSPTEACEALDVVPGDGSRRLHLGRCVPKK